MNGLCYERSKPPTYIYFDHTCGHPQGLDFYNMSFVKILHEDGRKCGRSMYIWDAYYVYVI
jgi:hypothetical protein